MTATSNRTATSTGIGAKTLQSVHHFLRRWITCNARKMLPLAGQHT